MKSRKFEIILQLLLIKEKYNSKEIKEAVEFLKNYDNIQDILYCFNDQSKNDIKEIYSKRSKRKEEQRSKAVAEIENIDIEKYKILSEFDIALREGKYLSTTSDLRKIGFQLSKGFDSKSDRRSLISNILSILVKLNMDEIKAFIEKVKNMSYSPDSDYKKLSDYIIKGSKEK